MLWTRLWCRSNMTLTTILHQLITSVITIFFSIACQGGIDTFFFVFAFPKMISKATHIPCCIVVCARFFVCTVFTIPVIVAKEVVKNTFLLPAEVLSHAIHIWMSAGWNTNKICWKLFEVVVKITCNRFKNYLRIFRDSSRVCLCFQYKTEILVHHRHIPRWFRHNARLDLYPNMGENMRCLLRCVPHFHCLKMCVNGQLRHWNKWICG